MKYTNKDTNNIKNASKSFFKRSKALISILIMTVCLSCVSPAFATGYSPKLMFYFSPGIMNDTTGEINVDVNIRNVGSAVPVSMGKLCAIGFDFEFDSDIFDIKTADEEDASQKAEIILFENTLIEKLSDTEVAVTDNKNETSHKTKVSFAFMDNTLKDNLIDKDGTLFSFTLVSKSPKTLWNSFDTYDLSFVPDSLAAVTYSDKKQVGRVYQTEGIDAKVGGYNTPPTLVRDNINKKITFTADSNSVKVNNLTENRQEVKDMDTDCYYKQDGENKQLMIPIRYLAENANLAVSWDSGVMQAKANAKYLTFTADLIKSAVYVNAAPIYSVNGTLIKPEEKDGRIFIPCTIVNEIFSGATVTQNGTEVEIYIP